MIENTIKVVVAMFCITALEMVAIANGINGVMLSLTIAALAGLGGYEVKNVKDYIKRRKDG